MSGRNNLSRQCQVSTEVFNSLGGKVAVGMLPAVGKTDVSARLKRFHEVENFEVGASLDVRVGGAYGILLDDENTLAEQVGEDCDAVGLGDEHCSRCCLDALVVFIEAKHEKLLLKKKL